MNTSTKTKKEHWTKEKAYWYLVNNEHKLHTLNELKEIWGWLSHMQVYRYLLKLEEDRLIKREITMQGQKINITNCVIL